MSEHLEPLLHYPTILNWGRSEESELYHLFLDGKKMVKEEEEVQLVYEMGKPADVSDDPIENMLNSEYYRITFEEENALHLEMKERLRAYHKRIERFARQNLLFLAFTLIEKRQTLCDDHEFFNRYQTWEELTQRMETIRIKLEDIGVQSLSTVVPRQLGETLRLVI